jgi:hypothetical protein
LRRLVPLTDLIQGVEKGASGGARGAGSAPRSNPAPPAPPRPAPRPPAATAATIKAVEARKEASASATAAAVSEPASQVPPLAAPNLKDAFLAEVRKAKKFFHGTVVAQAQRIDIEGDRVVFAFAPQHRALRVQLEQMRTWLETLATDLAGRKMAVVGVEGTSAGPGAGAAAGKADAAAPAPDRQAALREQALADSGVQAMLDVFSAEIRDVEEM